MTYAEIKQMVASIGLPCSYYQWPEEKAPDLPYILFYFPENNDFVADGKNYAKVAVCNIELYTEEKDFATETMVEDLLEANDLPYTKEEQYIETERMFEVLYVVEILLTD